MTHTRKRKKGDSRVMLWAVFKIFGSNIHVIGHVLYHLLKQLQTMHMPSWQLYSLMRVGSFSRIVFTVTL